MSAQVRLITTGDPLTDSTWVVLEGYVEGCPAVTKRRSINAAALVSGDLTLDGEKAALIADVDAYYQNYIALQEVLQNL